MQIEFEGCSANLAPKSAASKAAAKAPACEKHSSRPNLIGSLALARPSIGRVQSKRAPSNPGRPTRRQQGEELRTTNMNIMTNGLCRRGDAMRGAQSREVSSWARASYYKLRAPVPAPPSAWPRVRPESRGRRAAVGQRIERAGEGRRIRRRRCYLFVGRQHH